MLTKTDKKSETMRRVILSQTEAIRKLEQENRSLADANKKLTAECEKINKVINEYSGLISALEEQRTQYLQLNQDIRNLRKTLKKRIQKYERKGGVKK